MAQLGKDMAFNQTCYCLLPNDGLDKDFLYYSMLFSVKSIIALSFGTIFGTITTSTFSDWQIPFPPLAEQETIAEALSDVDALIEGLKQLLAKKRQVKQGAMQELLTGKKRLPGFEKKAGYKQTEIGIVPEDWEVEPLGQRLRRHPTYGINAPAANFDFRFPTYLRITDITDDGRFATETKVSVNHPMSGSYILEPGDLVFARTGASVGKSYLYEPQDGELVFAGFLIRISPDPEQLVPAFLKYFVQSRPFRNWVRVNSMRTGQPGINGQEYASLPVPIPPTTAEQTAIAEILSDKDAEIATLEAKIDKARKIKLGMMQELLTGRIRLI
jgi:type I restriction enzyme S subunit